MLEPGTAGPIVNGQREVRPGKSALVVDNAPVYERQLLVEKAMRDALAVARCWVEAATREVQQHRWHTPLLGLVKLSRTCHSRAASERGIAL